MKGGKAVTPVEFGKWVESKEWIASKDKSHQYLVKERTPASPEASWEEIVEFIRKNGRSEAFRGKDYTCYCSGGFKYWTMGEPVPETIIINRAKRVV